VSSPVISVENLSKAYNLYDSPRDIFKEALFGGIRHDVFWALKDVSFEIAEKQRVGIIGPNGAGKTTLLRIISGNLSPTSGSIDVNGTVSAMLSLTSFLNPEDTGIENIRFNLILNGCPRGRIPELTEEIVDFTELGAFIHAPVRTYSTGMHARLAFSISTAITPDVLIVDEILGAGDAYFMGKATKRMLDLCDAGRALLFVSHSTAAVQMLCDTAIWMDGGVIREAGPVGEVIRRYEDHFRRVEDVQIRSGNRLRRDRLIDTVRPEEFARPDVLRFRLTDGGQGMKGQHYIRRAIVAFDGEERIAPLELVTIEESQSGLALDVLGSEWGRQHTRRGSECRSLAPSSATFRGGHILARRPKDAEHSVVTVEIESEADAGVSTGIQLQYIDLSKGEWTDLPRLQDERLEDGWLRTRFEAELQFVSFEAHRETAKRLLESNRPDAEIVELALLVEGRRADSVREHQPFEVVVALRTNRVVPVLDAGIRLIRADGVYAFWQSSGAAGSNICDAEGEYTVRFTFDPNVFGAGTYEVTAYLANGFDPVDNYPYSEVYDRKVNDLRIEVLREHRDIDFGVVNSRVPVRVDHGVVIEGRQGLSHVASG
jgi:lipopolysaccharide transport system ATP-binding protein